MKTTDKNLAEVLDIDLVLYDEGHYDKDDTLRDELDELGFETTIIRGGVCSIGFRVGPESFVKKS